MGRSCPECGRPWGSKGRFGGLVKLYAKGLCKSCYNGQVPYRTKPQTLDDPALADRFWGKVAKGETEECWMWKAGTNPHGYGMFMFNGVPLGAHRMSWALHHGKLPVKHVCHTCDNPGCVNPDHLWEGSARQNHLDTVKKGRHPNQRLGVATELLKKSLPSLSPALFVEVSTFLSREKSIRGGGGL